MIFEKAERNEFTTIKKFYWNLIDEMSDVNDQIGWKKGCQIRHTWHKYNSRKTLYRMWFPVCAGEDNVL